MLIFFVIIFALLCFIASRQAQVMVSTSNSREKKKLKSVHTKEQAYLGLNIFENKTIL